MKWLKLLLLFILCSGPGTTQALSQLLTATLTDKYYQPYLTREGGSARLGAPSRAFIALLGGRAGFGIQACVVENLLPHQPFPHHQGTRSGTPVGDVVTPQHTLYPHPQPGLSGKAKPLQGEQTQYS